jgi:tetratricopeptide (TPR) repeat protein
MTRARIRQALPGRGVGLGQRVALTLGVFVLGLSAFSAIGYAQTGRLKGKVVDAENKPVEGAVILMVSKEMNRKLSTKTDRRGEYTQFLAPGEYNVTATKGDLTQSLDTRVSIDEKELNFTLKPGGAGGGAAPSAADVKKAEAERAAIKTAFDQGVALSGEGKFDEAVAKFNEVIVKVPKCVECYTNIGEVYSRKKDYDQAEVAYKKAIEVNPNSAEAYMGLANVYNVQKKYPQATEAGAQAQKILAANPGGSAGGAGASAAFNQGVIAWNESKIAEAQKFFEQAVAADPKMAEAHYWLGMANVNQNKMPEAIKSLEEYLKLDPSGKYADQAKGILTAIKK